MLLSIYPNELNIYIHIKTCIWMLIVVVQSLSYVRLCDPMYCSMPGFPVLHHLPELAQTHVHWLSDAIQTFHPLSSPSPPAINLPQHQSLFLKIQLFTSGGQSIGASASASVLPMNIQGWFLLGLTGLISLKSKGLSILLSNTTVQKHQCFRFSLLYGPTLTSIHDYWKNISFVVHWRREWQTTWVFLPWESYEQYEKAQW